jgi:Kef-type K+ transport system membrane component KefB
VGRQDSREGQVVLGAAVIDDVLGVLLLALLYEFSRSGDLSLANVGRLALFVGLFFVLAPLAAKLHLSCSSAATTASRRCRGWSPR